MKPSPLLGPAEIRDLAALLDIQPTKKLGQNFLIDANVVRRIVKIAGLEADDTVLEVGPGLGSLTLGLLGSAAEVIAIEIDSRLAGQLPATVKQFDPPGTLTVIRADALKVDTLPLTPGRLVANLPYNISVPVLLHLLEHFSSLRSGVVMVQAEVGHRLAADPGSKVYGSPSVKAAWYGSWQTAGLISRQVFWPVPNVDSVLVTFQRHEKEPGDETLRRQVFHLVDAAFGQRRKMMRQALASVLGGSQAAAEVLQSAGIPPTERGEQLLVHDFIRLAEAAAQRGISPAPLH